MVLADLVINHHGEFVEASKVFSGGSGICILTQGPGVLLNKLWTFYPGSLDFDASITGGNRRLFNGT